MISQGRLRALFTQKSSQMFRIVWIDNANEEECYLHLCGIPNKQLAEIMCEALNLFHMEADNGKFHAQEIEPEVLALAA